MSLIATAYVQYISYCGGLNEKCQSELSIVLKNNKVKTDFKEQIKIENAEQRMECIDYWEHEKTKASYNEESFVDS